MPRTLYVHVGPRKTGTSAFQHILRKHENSVVLYPKVGLWGDGSHHGLVFRFFNQERSGKSPKEDIQALFRAIGEEAERSDKDILISSEALRAESDIRRFIDALRPYVGGDSTEVELLVVYREHFARAASWYNHRIRAVGERRSPDEFLNDVASMLCYEPLLTKLQGLGSRITIFTYSPPQTIVARLLAHIGFPPAWIPNVEAKRVSLSPRGLVTKLAINNLLSDQGLNRQCYLKFNELPDSHSPSQFIFGSTAAAQAEEIYRRDREFLRCEFGVQAEPPCPSPQTNAFYLGPEAYEQIAGVAKNMGSLGDEILQYVSRYVREDNQPVGGPG